MYLPFYSEGEEAVANPARNIVPSSVDLLSIVMKCISEPVTDEPGPPPVQTACRRKDEYEYW